VKSNNINNLTYLFNVTMFI